jgi:ketosteroid isomerase-like protein
MRRSTILLLGLALLPQTLCAAGPEADPASLKQADRDFGKALADRDRARFRSFVAGDAVFFGGGERLDGAGEVAKAWEPFFEEKGPRLRWEPLEAFAAASSDLGYTIGRYELSDTGEGGAPRVRTGQYVTIWKRKDGAWKAAVDIGTPPQAAAAATPAATRR